MCVKIEELLPGTGGRLAGDLEVGRGELTLCGGAGGGGWRSNSWQGTDHWGRGPNTNIETDHQNKGPTIANGWNSMNDHWDAW